MVSLSKQDEKALNIALNKIGGAWDTERLKAALEDLSLSPIDFGTIGFTYPEVDVLLNGQQQEAEAEPPSVGRMEFTFSLEQFADLEQATKLVAAKYGPDQMETFREHQRPRQPALHGGERMGRAKEIDIRVIPAKIANPFMKAHHYSGKVVNNSSLHFRSLPRRTPPRRTQLRPQPGQA